MEFDRESCKLAGDSQPHGHSESGMHFSDTHWSFSRLSQDVARLIGGVLAHRCVGSQRWQAGAKLPTHLVRAGPQTSVGEYTAVCVLQACAAPLRLCCASAASAQCS